MDQLHDATALERRLVNKANQQHIPITANFELTPTCTLKCDMCFIRSGYGTVEQAGGLLSLRQWLKWAEQLKEMGTLFILLTGGEPMLYPDFDELYTLLRKMGFILTINTNGTLINEQTIRTFQVWKPRRVNVTLYGSSEDTYRRLCHHPEGYNRCLNGLKLLKQADIDVKLNVSIVRKNLNDYERIIRLAQELDIPAEVNSYMFPLMRSECESLRYIPNERLDADEAARIEMQYIEYKKGNSLSQYMNELKFTLAHITDADACTLGCRAAKSSCWINWRGVMTPCVLMENPAISLQQTPLPDAWKQLISAVGQLAPHTECEGCQLRPVCNVCYAAASCEKEVTGNINYLCRMAQAKAQIIKDYQST